MTRIDFYSLAPNSQGDRFILTCRLVERIHSSGARVLIHCPDVEQARHLDRLLWTFREESFLPHGRVGQIDSELTPILISGDGSPTTEHQVLINLAPDAPGFFTRFARLCEPIDHDPAIRTAGRERFRQYRDQGHPLQHHPVQL
ncbi:MAG: DNA polymerase III subunit chi [Sphingobacteriia bacterium]|nr:DNA polymerase III subunit chi [Sphingobacteriia bacterium]NCC37905.1 DNA polymerase III subunit chi [Gammaproteobacteria bacterium]